VGLNIEGEDDTTVYFPFEWIVDAKLVLTDQLMKRGAEQRAARIQSDNDDLSESEED
jgi:ribosome maturation factor RimP